MNWTLVLASQSPRRQSLLSSAGYDFDVLPIDVEEVYPDHLTPTEIVVYLAELKSRVAQKSEINSSTIITADTVVVLDGEILGKPRDRKDAINTLERLSGRSHLVHTGVSVLSNDQVNSEYDTSTVYFCDLNGSEIEYYIDHYKPLDKAGSYGIQDWLGLCKVKRIEGSHSNIMGLPMELTYRMLARVGILPEGLHSRSK